jgi:hypothetical protein
MGTPVPATNQPRNGTRKLPPSTRRIASVEITAPYVCLPTTGPRPSVLIAHAKISALLYDASLHRTAIGFVNA